MIYKQIELAKRCGVTRSTISVNIKRGNLPETLDDIDPRVIEYITKCDVKKTISTAGIDVVRDNIKRSETKKNKQSENKIAPKKKQPKKAPQKEDKQVTKYNEAHPYNGQGYGSGGGRKSVLQQVLDTNNGVVDPELLALAAQKKIVADSDSAVYDSQSKKIDLEEKCKDLIRTDTADYYFTGYIDRLTAGLLRNYSKWKVDIDGAFQSLYIIIPKEYHKQLDKAIDDSIAILKKANESVLQEIQKEQKQSVEQWKIEK